MFKAIKRYFDRRAARLLIESEAGDLWGGWRTKAFLNRLNVATCSDVPIRALVTLKLMIPYESTFDLDHYVTSDKVHPFLDKVKEIADEIHNQFGGVVFDDALYSIREERRVDTNLSVDFCHRYMAVRNELLDQLVELLLDPSHLSYSQRMLRNLFEVPD